MYGCKYDSQVARCFNASIKKKKKLFFQSCTLHIETIVAVIQSVDKIIVTNLIDNLRISHNVPLLEWGNLHLGKFIICQNLHSQLSRSTRDHGDLPQLRCILEMRIIMVYLVNCLSKPEQEITHQIANHLESQQTWYKTLHDLIEINNETGTSYFFSFIFFFFFTGTK